MNLITSNTIEIINLIFTTILFISIVLLVKESFELKVNSLWAIVVSGLLVLTNLTARQVFYIGVLFDVEKISSNGRLLISAPAPFLLSGLSVLFAGYVLEIRYRKKLLKLLSELNEHFEDEYKQKALPVSKAVMWEVVKNIASHLKL